MTILDFCCKMSKNLFILSLLFLFSAFLYFLDSFKSFYSSSASSQNQFNPDQSDFSDGVCSANWGSSKNVWMIETSKQESVSPLLLCAMESFATKMPHHCIRYYKSVYKISTKKILDLFCPPPPPPLSALSVN